MCVAVALILGAAYALLAPRTTTVASLIEVKKIGPQVLPDRESSEADNDGYLNTQLALIRSTPILATALDMPGADDFDMFRDVRSRVNYLKRELQVEVGRKDEIITVSLASRYPEEARRMVDAIVESYRATQAKQKREVAREVLGHLERAKERNDKEIEAKSAAIIEFQQKHNTLSFEGDKSNFAMQRLASLSDALTNAHLETINAKTSFEAAARVVTDDPKAFEDYRDGGVALSAQDEELLRAELFSLKQQLQERRRTYLADHPTIKSLESRINQLNMAYVASARMRWKAAEARAVELQKSFDEAQKFAMTQKAQATEYERLLADVKGLRGEQEKINTRMREVEVTLEAGALNIRVVEQAEEVPDSVSPNKARTLVFAGLLGLLLGCGLAVGREWIDPRLSDATEVKDTLGIPVFGMIPQLPAAPSPETLGWAVHLDPQSDVADAYRAVRTSLQFGAEGQSKSIVIASAASDDGKSTLASNLAMALAKAGKRVLLIDADFRAPSQHRIFGVSDEVGFSTCLLSGELVDRAIRRTTVERLQVMPAGPVPRNPSELLNSTVFEELLVRLSKEYDHLLFDTPAVSESDDARIVAGSCDSTILVLRAERTNRKLAEDARDALLSVGARLLGVVVNGTPGNRGGFSGFGSLTSRRDSSEDAGQEFDHETQPATGSGHL